MNIWESIKSAVSSVLGNKMRSLLTMLGIIIGVGSVIIITAIGAGSTNSISSQFDSMGIGNLTVSLVSGSEIRNADQLTMDDVDLLAEMEDIKYISPVYNGNGMVVKLEDPKETKSATVTGVNEQYKDIQSTELLYGRYITATDVDMGSKVVVIDDTTATAVFGECGEWVLGGKISLKGRGTSKYTVIGIQEDSSAAFSAMSGDESPATVIMPVTTAMRAFRANYVSSIAVTGADSENLTALGEEITTALSAAHENEDKYNVMNIADLVDTITSVMGTLTLLISCIAAISLVVGGIGVMNIMLVTVTERTREIGIRKSIGAKNKDIRFQFVTESIILTAMGGAVGVLLGWGGGILAGNYMGIEASINPQSVFIAVFISAFIGIVFGVYPADKAAKLDPIEALRYE